MRFPITDAPPDACTNSDTATGKGNDVAFESAELRLKEHLSGWGAPFADIGDKTVRGIAVILKEHWRRGTASDTEQHHRP
ncbi:hypothetical protein ASC97_07515 [Rhizobium sp. Root1203]|nr:hypothetical protein ASC97_07515 [Rhizobium sp. Root1203]